MSPNLRTSDFGFDLPQNLIANKPSFPRDESKMLILNQQIISESQSKNLDQFLNKGDVLILNDSKVLKAKIIGYNQNGANININLHQEKSDSI